MRQGRCNLNMYQPAATFCWIIGCNLSSSPVDPPAMLLLPPRSCCMVCVVPSKAWPILTCWCGCAGTRCAPCYLDPWSVAWGNALP
jgi:hypothetical protein